MDCEIPLIFYIAIIGYVVLCLILGTLDISLKIKNYIERRRYARMINEDELELQPQNPRWYFNFCSSQLSLFFTVSQASYSPTNPHLKLKKLSLFKKP